MIPSALKSKSPRTSACANLVPTELFDIQSSPQKPGEGPRPRVLKHKGEKYMLPRSPESPTVRSQRGSGAGRSRPPSGSVHRRTKDCFISVDGLFRPIQKWLSRYLRLFFVFRLPEIYPVSHLAVESFQLDVAAKSSWSPSRYIPTAVPTLVN